MFSAVFVVKVPFSIRLFDVLMLANLLLMPLVVNLSRVPAWIPGFLLYLAASGSIGVARGTDSIPQFTKEFLGISVSLLYAYYFFKLIRNDFEAAFRDYARVAFWFAVIGFPLWASSCMAAHGYERFRGLTSEPESFCTLVLPAYYWYVYLFITSRKGAIQVLVFTLAVALSGSSMGYLSVAFGAMLLMARRKRYFIAIPVVAAAIVGFAYFTSASFRVRADDTLLALSSQDVSGTNLSTYALISNVFVTQQVLRESPVIGNGLGSHPLSHARFLGDIPGVERFVEIGAADLNAPDAASLALRVLSELGVLGFLGMVGFLFYFYVGGMGARAAISNAILAAFFLKLVRGGIYFPPEQFFFALIYCLNHHDSRRQAELRARRVSPHSPGMQLANSRI